MANIGCQLKQMSLFVQGGFITHMKMKKVKSLEQLLDIYFSLRLVTGLPLNLNIPPDRKGQIYKTDSVRLIEFKEYIDKAFSKNLLEGCKAEANNNRGGNFQAGNLTDNDPTSYWATENDVKNAIIEFKLEKNVAINCVVIQEYIQLGQRVTDFSIEVFEKDYWKEIAKGSTIGYKKIVQV